MEKTEMAEESNKEWSDLEGAVPDFDRGLSYAKKVREDAAKTTASQASKAIDDEQRLFDEATSESLKSELG